MALNIPYRFIGLLSRSFANGPGDPDSVACLVKVRIKGKEEQSRERSSALFYTLV